MIVTSTIGFQNEGTTALARLHQLGARRRSALSVSFYALIILVFPAWVAAISIAILYFRGCAGSARTQHRLLSAVRPLLASYEGCLHIGKV